MNREEIIRMAREADFDLEMWQLSFGCNAVGTHEELERFFQAAYAAGVAAERDRMCEQFNISKDLAHEKAKSNETD